MIVYVGNEECKIVPYYTTNDQIYCITPPCDSDGCLRRTNGWNAREVVDVSVYVTTVVGILGAHTLFTYSTVATPIVSTLTRNLWSTCTGSISGYFDTTLLSNIAVKFDKHFSHLGFDGEINADDLSSWHYSTKTIRNLYYRPPFDLTAGYYNISVTFSNPDTLMDDVDTGLANLFPFDSSKTQYTLSPSGVVYTSAIYPVITRVSPSNGSIAGGTAVTIDGYGFSSSVADMTVLVAGVPCSVVKSTANQITCITDKIEAAGSTQAVVDAFVSSEPYANMQLSGGSPGSFVQLFDSANNLIQSFPWHQGLAMYELLGNTNPFTADVGTVLIAPYSGEYSFLIWVDDAASIYYSLTGYGVNEKLLWTTTFSTMDGSFYTNSNQMSR
jgi:IPT/TIG domain